jgi:deltex-like protein
MAPSLFSRFAKSSSSKSSQSPPLDHAVHKECLAYDAPLSLLPLSMRQGPQGTCPSGTLTMEILPNVVCPGFSPPATTLKLFYDVPNGTQRPYHPHPSVPYDGTQRTAYLPNTLDGRRLLTKFKYAWTHGLLLAVGKSITNHKDNQTTWSDIPHKTSLQGGTFGFPDATYIEVCNQAMDKAGVPASADACAFLLEQTKRQAPPAPPPIGVGVGVAAGGSVVVAVATVAPSVSAASASVVTAVATASSTVATVSSSVATTTKTADPQVCNETIPYQAPRTLATSKLSLVGVLLPYVPTRAIPILPVAASSSISTTAILPCAPPPPCSHPMPSAPPADDLLWTGAGSGSMCNLSQVASALHLQPVQMIDLPPIPPPLSTTTTTTTVVDDVCAVCLDPLSTTTTTTTKCVQIRHCRHAFHDSCILDCLQRDPKCPICRFPITEPQGKSPSGTMTIQLLPESCPGFRNDTGNQPATTLCITYEIPRGIQHVYHDHPSVAYSGTSRVAYLPNTRDGRRLLLRLKYAWTHGLTFCVGTSLTSGQAHVVTWTSIHHKTSLTGGPHGFPTVGYLEHCNESLDALFVPSVEELL